MSDDYNLIISFPDESASFVNGFEAGEIWRDMHNNLSINRPIHTGNKEVVERMAVASGYDVTITETEVDGWLNLEGEKRRPRLDKGNPNSFKVIK